MRSAFCVSGSYKMTPALAATLACTGGDQRPNARRQSLGCLQSTSLTSTQF